MCGGGPFLHAAVNEGNGLQVSGGRLHYNLDSLSLQNGQHGITVTARAGVLLSANNADNSQESGATYHGIRQRNKRRGFDIVKKPIR